VMSGIAVLAFLTWYGRDHNPTWLEWTKVVVAGLKAGMIQVGDYAYIPPECSLSRDGRWHWTLRGGRQWPPGYTPYVPPAEPTSDQQGFEGAVKWEQSNVIKALVRAYEVLGDEDALAHAWQLARFCLKPTLWEPGDDNGHPGIEHGVWAGHLHGNLNALSALLDLATATGDSHLKQLVRQGYEHARSHGAIRLGWMPSWIAPQRFGRPASAAVESEGCGIADTLMLAVQLTDAGLGDYWDDVDAIVRNHLIELQMVDLAAMRCACGSAEYDSILQRFVGGFTQAVLTANLRSAIYGCCTGNGTRSLYHAWEAITRFHQGVATVNLWLNRASTWLDIDSYLPYEGKVVLHNKQAHTLLVRIPYWVNRQALVCSLNERPVAAEYAGNTLLFQGLQPGDTLFLDFPIPETTERYTIGDQTYTATLRGSTVVDLQPRATADSAHRNKVPFFLREELRGTVAPLQTVQRFVPEQVLPVY
ncbi:MAG: glycoside hydrolase family 127 protein, partial [Caldilineaceae bacterium]|nr:glycoside hydrolase family 127 protein [Caldilineaceae bacterium]